MDKEIGSLIAQNRKEVGLTQDQYGKKYNVSGPAIFKFERGQVKPSLILWLKMAKDLNVTENKAVLMWVRRLLPKKYQGFIELEPATVQESRGKYGKTARGRAAGKSATPTEARNKVLADPGTPRGLKQLLKDDDLWTLYKPTTEEIDVLKEIFGRLGNGSKSSYRQALRLVREFTRA